MKDDLANYRLVELAKQKGFPKIYEDEMPYQEITPTLSLLEKWLRKTHFLHVASAYKMNIKKWDFIVYNLNLTGKEYVKYYREYYKKYPDRRYESFEDAMAVGIEEALNLLPDVKKE